MIIITKPTFVDPDNPTSAETAAQALYESRLQTVRLIVSPDLISMFDATELPDAVLADDGYLGAAEREVLRHSGKTAAEVAALAVDSEELALLVYATQLQMAIRMIPQLAQMIQEGLLSETQRFAEVDWEQRKAGLLADYKTKVLLVNPDADIGSDGLGSPVALLTASMLTQ